MVTVKVTNHWRRTRISWIRIAVMVKVQVLYFDPAYHIGPFDVIVNPNNL